MIKYYSLRFSACAISLLLLAGCQQRMSPSVSPLDAQIQQLSSMVAASDWLRDHCNRSDIPVQRALLRETMTLATERGLRFTEPELKKIQAETEDRYQEISADTTDKSAKCSTLTHEAMPLLQRFSANDVHER
ncbi:type II secretion system pilot lipoprotein GspS [Enterobacteriaceae bacterium LUAb1]